MPIQPIKHNASLLDAYVWGRIRRNHGLEHATLHILARRFPASPLAGHSDAGGFWIIGDVPLDDLRTAVSEALNRLRQGERQLAVHPNCGTNLVTTGALTGLGGALAMLGAGPRRRELIGRFPLAVVLATLAFIVSRPLGSYLQSQITTSGDPGALGIVEYKLSRRGKWQACRIDTRDSQ